jgi:hypothetical protein
MTDSTFIGWLRLPGQLWQPVVTAADEDEAWRLLRQHVDQLHAKMIDTFVGPSDIDPRGRRRPTRQGKLFRGLVE